MDDLLEKNLLVLERYQPEFVKCLRNKISCIGAIEKVQIKGQTRIAGATIPPFTEELSDLSGLFEPRLPVAIIQGVGSSAYFFNILKHLPKWIRIVIIIDPHLSLIVNLLKEISLYDVLSRVLLVFIAFDSASVIDEAIKVAFASRGFLVGRKQLRILHKEENEATGEAIPSLFRLFGERLEYYISLMGNSPDDSLLGLRQMALSSPWTLFGARLQPLRDTCSGFSAIIVSAGPSLDKNINILKKNKDKYIIIAVDTIVEKLLINGIKPHFVCVLERVYALYLECFRPLFKDWRKELSDVILVSQSVCTPQIVGRWPGPVVVVGKDDINLEKAIVGHLLGGTVIPSGASVSHMCLGLAWYLGVSSAALVGQDLAYGDMGESHARDYTFLGQETYEAGIPESERLVVEGIAGFPVRTNRWWKYFRDVFSAMIPRLGVPVSDCTEGGAFIPQTDVLPLQTFAESHIPSNTNIDLRVFFIEKIRYKSDKMHLDEYDDVYDHIQGNFVESLNCVEDGLKYIYNLNLSLVSNTRLTNSTYIINKYFNEIIAKNPYLAFILQFRIGQIIAETFSEALPVGLVEVRKWANIYKIFFEDARKVIKSAQGWLMYIDGVRQMREQILRILFSDEEVSEADIVKYCVGTNESFRDAILVDIFFAKTDIIENSWSVYGLWSIASHFIVEKRFTEASDMLRTATENAKSVEMGPEDYVRLNLDAAECLLSPDLCRQPELSKAHDTLAEVYSLSPENKKLLELTSLLIHTQLNILETYGIPADYAKIAFFKSLESSLPHHPDKILEIIFKN